MNKIRLYENTVDCSGCGACLTVCPKNAITMEPDATGCLYPRIDQQRCIACGACLRACAFQKADGYEPVQAFAAVGRQEETVQNSASGGIFATLAQCVLEAGGAVAGAVMEQDLAVRHILSCRQEDLARMQGSKYVQSESFVCYPDVIKALKEGETVLFSGTPCQTAAVRHLTGDPENLITMDLICHGVPPQKMLTDFAKLLGKRFGGQVKNIKFRDKSGQKPFTAAVMLQKGKKTRVLRLRAQYLSFYKYFLEGVTYRESCYSCPYAGLKRCADLTVGDYWGIEEHHEADMKQQKMPSRKDWSCVLVNTPKGQAFFKAHQDALLCFETRALWVAAQNRQLQEPSKKPPRRDRVIALYREKGYEAVEKAYIKENGGLRFYWRILKQLKK